MTTYTREDWRARPARSGPGALDPDEVEGLALHWPGMGTHRLSTVPAVMEALRGWQNDHMDNPAKRWSDIAYQEAVDQMGNRYRLRGLATQSAANGDQDVNRRFGAVLLIVAEGEAPSDKMMSTTRQVVADFRRLYPAATKLVGHNAIRPEGTACPGPIVSGLIRSGALAPAITKREDPKMWRTVVPKWHPARKLRLRRLSARRSLVEARGYAHAAYENTRGLDRDVAQLHRMVQDLEAHLERVEARLAAGEVTR